MSSTAQHPHTPYVYQRQSNVSCTLRWLIPNILRLNHKNKISSPEFEHLEGFAFKLVALRLVPQPGDAHQDCAPENLPLSIFVEVVAHPHDTPITWAVLNAVVIDNFHTKDSEAVEMCHLFAPHDRAAGFKALAPWDYINSPAALRDGEKSEAVLVQISIKLTGSQVPTGYTPTQTQLLVMGSGRAKDDAELVAPLLPPEAAKAARTTLTWGATTASSAFTSLFSSGKTLLDTVAKKAEEVQSKAQQQHHTRLLPPWHDIPFAWKSEPSAWTELILYVATQEDTYRFGPERELSSEERAKLSTLLGAQLASSLDFTVRDTESLVPATLPEALLDDAAVARLRFELVPRVVPSSEVFWSRLYWRVRELAKLGGAVDADTARQVVRVLNNEAMKVAAERLGFLCTQCLDAARLLTDLMSETNPSAEDETARVSARESCTSFLKSLSNERTRFEARHGAAGCGGVSEDLSMRIDATVLFAEEALKLQLVQKPTAPPTPPVIAAADAENSKHQKDHDDPHNTSFGSELGFSPNPTTRAGDEGGKEHEEEHDNVDDGNSKNNTKNNVVDEHNSDDDDNDNEHNTTSSSLPREGSSANIAKMPWEED
eukprot:PhM_4_TR5020/c0_g1_i1/m.105877